MVIVIEDLLNQIRSIISSEQKKARSLGKTLHIALGETHYLTTTKLLEALFIIIANKEFNIQFVGVEDTAETFQDYQDDQQLLVSKHGRYHISDNQLLIMICHKLGINCAPIDHPETYRPSFVRRLFDGTRDKFLSEELKKYDGDKISVTGSLHLPGLMDNETLHTVCIQQF